ncbi:unnamed protein product [Cercospora beticola]|nr:unnamed protein product [Cercospora beticola]
MAADGNSEHDSSTDSKSDIESKSSVDTEVLELRERLESLPQELYNHVYDLTFTANPRIRIYGFSRWARLYLCVAVYRYAISGRVITLDERLPSMFRVDRASRRKFAKSYFGGEDSTFIFCGRFGTRTCFKAMPDYRALISNLLWSCEQPIPAMEGSTLAQYYRAWWLDESPKNFKFLSYDEIESLVRKACSDR